MKHLKKIKGKIDYLKFDFDNRSGKFKRIYPTENAF